MVGGRSCGGLCRGRIVLLRGVNMSRKGAAVLGLAQAELNVSRPAPPADLIAEEAAIWRQIVDDMPANWFARATWPVLVELCRHICLSRAFIEQLRAVRAKKPTSETVRMMDKLAKMHAQQSRNIAQLSQKLRLTQYYDQRSLRKVKAQLAGQRKPWEIPPENENEEE